MRADAGEDSPARSRMRNSAGGARDREDGCTNPLVLTLPSVTPPQSVPQDLLESAGPAGRFARAFPQQHFARPRQQDELDAVSDPAASGARHANEKSRARHAAMMPRANRERSLFPSILGREVYHANRANLQIWCKFVANKGHCHSSPAFPRYNRTSAMPSSARLLAALREP